MIVVLVFVPLFALPGIEGRLFAPLGVAYIVAILASLVVSVTLTPVLAYWLLGHRRSSHRQDSFVLRAMKRLNRAVVLRGMAAPSVVYGAMLLMFGVAAWGAWNLPRAFLPSFNEGTVLVTLSFRPGISLPESSRLGSIAERLVAECAGGDLRRPPHGPRGAG
jgi:HME family heavy-metal exporter